MPKAAAATWGGGWLFVHTCAVSVESAWTAAPPAHASRYPPSLPVPPQTFRKQQAESSKQPKEVMSDERKSNHYTRVVQQQAQNRNNLCLSVVTRRGGGGEAGGIISVHVRVLYEEKYQAELRGCILARQEQKQQHNTPHPKNTRTCRVPRETNSPKTNFEH